MKSRLLLVLLVFSALLGAPTVAHAADPGDRVALRQLVIAVDSADFGLATWKSALDRVGSPYDVLLAGATPLGSLVRDDGVGRYDAVLLTSAALLTADGAGGYTSALDAGEWTALWNYEATFHVRQVALYAGFGTFPEDYCLRSGNEEGIGAAPQQASLTAAGASIFDYLRSGSQIPIQLSYVYRSQLAPGCAAIPVLTIGPDVVAVSSTAPDGRERMALTFTSNQYLPQADLLTYGLVRWATHGVFVGEQRHWLNVDVDDLFNTTDHLLADGTRDPAEFRITGEDLAGTAAQQTALRQSFPQASAFTLNLAYNGEGINAAAPAQCSTDSTPDPLTSYARCLSGQFRWINHTFSHPKMNTTTYADSSTEITTNLTAGNGIGLSVPTTVLKTPEYSGLGVYHPDPNNDIDPPTDYGLAASNQQMLNAAKAAGVKYLHGNMSFPSHRPACVNCSTAHPMTPALLLVPDWPTNIAYHVTTPEEETTFYNSYYGPAGRFPAFDHDLTYTEIVDQESKVALGHLTAGSIYSHTLHQGNLRQYEPGHSLTFDWLTALLGKYNQLYSVPLRTYDWPTLASYTSYRNTHFAVLAGGNDVVWARSTNSLTYTSTQAGSLFITGVKTSGYDQYGTDLISRITFTTGVTKYLALPK
ncbi:hypothetical protein Lfu02_39510 [Longispora fulva]|uniref:NodB homology domain-containing protein n=1 Tax=Longispora fulva TaxID=619741 RepID=A0A8J7GST1_9ACTN|nr:hypothetical protein [Longispora fulva]MBG6136411.1 hypothetical protein [Longispora fulva]GIG59579.1 hypothetical protein Lfu02_39510 [Longispora fulva]